MSNWSIGKKLFYYFIFSPLHFLHYNLSPALTDEMGEEFMNYFHKNDIND